MAVAAASGMRAGRTQDGARAPRRADLGCRRCRPAFDDLGAARVSFKTDALNARSRSAIARLGAREDGTLRHARLRNDGSVRDSTYFSILAAEWPQVRAGLQARLE